MGGDILRSRAARILLAFPILLLTCINLHAGVKVLRVDPHRTDPAIATVHGPHLAANDPKATPRHRLLLFLVGTHVQAADGLDIVTAFAQWGFHAISLDYENNVIAVSNAHSMDRTSFGRYREAIVTGAAVSTNISVDPANSILNRFRRLLIYLVRSDPRGGWNEFLDKDQPVWSRIIVAGHSQGSGHAAYIGKLFRVDRVLMFSGPQDYMDDLDAPAPWQERSGATPPAGYFAFLNLEDPYNVHHQIANCMALMDMSKADTLTVEPGEVIRGDHHILINDVHTNRHHNSTLFPQFESIWEYMATTPE